MKKYTFIFLLIAAAIGCSKEGAAELSVGESEIKVTNSYNKVNIPITCTTRSSAHIEYDGESGWIFLLPTVLNGNGVYSLWISEYSNVLQDRSARLVVTAGDITQTINVTQLSRSSIGISPENLATTAASGDYKVSVACRREWSVKADDDASGWCTVDRNSGNGPGEVTVHVEALEGDSETQTGHLTFESDGLKVQITIQHGYAQTIGETVWAKANVDKPGYFAATPDSRGLLYQYNSKTGWPNSSPETSDCPEGMRIGQYDSGVDDWLAENDPCPEGWRVPSIDEIKALAGNGEKRFSWLEPAASGFAVPGAVAGLSASDAATASKDNMKGGIFIPQTGSRNKDTGRQDNWWSASMTSRTRPGQNWDRYIFWIDQSGNYDFNGFDGNAAAYPVRCVAVK